MAQVYLEIILWILHFEMDFVSTFVAADAATVNDDDSARWI